MSRGLVTLLATTVVLAASVSSACATTVTGRNQDGVRVHLAGRLLDVRLPLALTWNPAVVRKRSRIVCGDDANGGLYESAWVLQTTHPLRLRRRQTHYVVRLARDVSARTNACAIETFPLIGWDLDFIYEYVLLTPVRGSGQPRCEPVGSERVVARSRVALVLRSDSEPYDYEHDSAYRTCLLPRSRSTFLVEAFFGLGGVTSVDGLMLNGHWAAWGVGGLGRTVVEPAMVRVDLTAPRPAKPEYLYASRPFGLSGQPEVTATALAPDGTLAWVVRGDNASELAVARPGQTRSLIDRIDTPGWLTAPSLSPDGETIGWLRDGVPQHVLVPAEPDDPTRSR